MRAGYTSHRDGSAAADGRLYVSDSVNRRIMVVEFEHADEKVCTVP